YHCRYGNGIGLSQQAAKGRCANGQNHYQVLDFYYPNMDLMNVTERNPELPYSYTKQIAAYGMVSASSARLRSGASTNDMVLDTLSRGTHVDIITEVDGWLVCIANNKLGYIRGDLVSVTLFPSPSGGEHPLGVATVKAGVLDAQLRTGPSEYSDPIIILYPGVSVQVWHRIGDWYHVRFAGRYAYIHASKVTEPIFDYAKVLRNAEGDIGRVS
ncbi:MAG: SH3 domain-containing protein, partial [Clostridia bacterium]|nr:SH3 domain-containing protein [Clostridia bacterium]